MNLSNILGTQGRGLVQTPQELDFVINELRVPPPDATVSKVLGYLYHYLPYVKQSHNLRLLVASFLNSPVCFGHQPDFEQNYLIIEVFKLIADKKLTISRPTLSIKEFYTVIATELSNFAAYNPMANSWKVLPIIAGLQLLSPLRDELYTVPQLLEYRWFFANWDESMLKLFKQGLQYSVSPSQPDDVVYLSLISLAIVFKKDDLPKNYTASISPAFIANKTMQLFFLHPIHSLQNYSRYITEPSPETERSVVQKPVIKHMNRIAFLLDAYFKKLPYVDGSFVLIMDSLNQIQNFNQHLNHSIQNTHFNHSTSAANENPPHNLFWSIVKNIFFAEVIIYQGILTRFLTSNNKNYFAFNPFQRRSLKVIEIEYRQIGSKILHGLYYVNFALLSIGQGGFDSYNFVYYLSVELALSGGNYESFTSFLIGNYKEVNLHPDSLNNNYVARAKVLFVLGLWENYLQSSSKKEPFIKEIYEICFNLADDYKYDDYSLIEAAHSALLLCFTNGTGHNLADCILYVELLFRQFPVRISANQFSIAIETLGKKLLSHHGTGEEFYQYLLSKLRNFVPGIPIKSDGDQKFASGQPIAEIEANSTLRNVDDKTRKEGDIISANKGKKPKDLVLLSPLPGARAHYEFQKRVIPETTREAFVVALINLVPYFPLSVFEEWLDEVWAVLNASNAEERNFLSDILWKVVSENLDLNRAELAYRWWYTKKGIARL